MRIGVDAGCWANDRGYGRFARELMSEMVRVAPNDEFVFLLDPASRRRFELSAPNVHTIDVAQSVSPTEAAAGDGARSPVDMLRFTRAVLRAKLDVFFCPSVYTYFPLPPGLRAVVGIHDAIAERFPSLTLPSARARLFWKAKVKLAVLQSTLVLSVSDFAADDVSSVIGVPRSKIRVAVEAPAAAFRPSESIDMIRKVAARFGLSDDDTWLIYVGGFNPHKNLDVLVRAYASAVREFSHGCTPYLLLVGTLAADVFHLATADIRSTIDELEVHDWVIWTDFVADEELRHLNSGALALVLPSDCEGFGLPAVEAAACGTAVIATTESPLPELLAGGGIFVEPRDEERLTDALRMLILDDQARATMAAKALERAGLLSWERCATEALAAIREAAA